MNKRKIEALFTQVRSKNPLVHHLTNIVTINDCANATLAIGASPVMATNIEEVETMASLANALVINIGTLQSEGFEAMLKAGKVANQKGIPVVFDPVGVGATPYRNDKAQQLLAEVDVAIIRGNTSEVGALMDETVQTRGVDVGKVTHLDTKQLARRVSVRYDTVVVISGREDIVSDGTRTVSIQNGDKWLPHITGTGCMSTSLIASFAGVSTSMFDAAIAGISVMGIAGEIAKQQLQVTDGIGLFRLKLMDALFFITGEKWSSTIQIVEQ